MLKVYKRTRYVSINNKKWYQLWHTDYVMTEDALHESVLVDNMSFDEFYSLLETNPMSHIHAGKTLFRKRPKISIEYTYDCEEDYTYFDTISCKVIYEEVELTLPHIVRIFSAELVIQYLKERGITTCSMNF